MAGSTCQLGDRAPTRTRAVRGSEPAGPMPPLDIAPAVIRSPDAAYISRLCERLRPRTELPKP